MGMSDSDSDDIFVYVPFKKWPRTKPKQKITFFDHIGNGDDIFPRMKSWPESSKYTDPFANIPPKKKASKPPKPKPKQKIALFDNSDSGDDLFPRKKSKPASSTYTDPFANVQSKPKTTNQRNNIFGSGDGNDILLKKPSNSTYTDPFANVGSNRPQLVTPKTLKFYFGSDTDNNPPPKDKVTPNNRPKKSSCHFGSESDD